MVQQVWGLIICTTAALASTGVRVISRKLLFKKFPEVNKKDLCYASNWVVSGLQACLATSMGLWCCWSCQLQLIQPKLPILQTWGWISLGYWFYDIVDLFQLANNEQEKGKSIISRIVAFVSWWPGLVAHHLVVLFATALGVLSTTRNTGDGLIAMAYIMELSSVFLASRGFLARLGMKSSSLYFYFSASMVLTFFVVRVLLVPFMVLLFCKEKDVHLIEGLGSLPIKCIIGTLFFYTLNSYWFALMIRGCVKTFNKRKVT